MRGLLHKKKEKNSRYLFDSLVTFGIVGAKVRSNACGVGEEQMGIIDTAPVITQTPVQVATQTPIYGENEQILKY